MRNRLLIGLIVLFVSGFSTAQPPGIKDYLSRHVFIENKGQIIDQNNNPNPGVLYLLNTPGMNVQLRHGGFSYDLYSTSSRVHESTNPSTRADSVFNSQFSIFNFHRIDFNLLGSNPNCEIVTTGTSSDYMNYYTTGTPVEGVTNVHSYKTVTYKNIYPGIDLEFISSDEIPFKYNFVVHPEGRIGDIKIRISGPEKVKKVRDVLRCETTIGEVDESIPKCFYKVDDLEIPVDGRFYRIAEHVYGFKVEQELPVGTILFIDPIPTRRWGTYYGGPDNESCYQAGCSIDQSGNIFICGRTSSVTNIATAGAFQTVLLGTEDAFLVKFSSAGQRLWGTYYGGNSFTEGYSCAADYNGNVFLVGRTSSTIMIATPGAYQTTLRSLEDGFIVKFTESGSRIWGTYYGGNEDPFDGEDYLVVCSSDTLGNLYAAGWTSSPDFIATPGSTQPSFGGQFDNYLVKFTSDGQRAWGTYYGGSSWELEAFTVVSKTGLIYLSGSTISANNIATPGSFMPIYNGIQKAYLACFTPDGTRQWGTYFGGESSDMGYGCIADTGSGVYLFGYAQSTTNIATPGVFLPTISGAFNGFIEKFNSAGARIWGTYIGPAGIFGGAVDDSGNVFITGQMSGNDSLCFSPGAYQTICRGTMDAILEKFTGDGQRIWGTYYGGRLLDRGLACVVDHYDHIYLYGNTNSINNFDPDTAFCTRDPLANHIATPGSHQHDYAGDNDVYLIKFADCWSPDTANQIFGPTSVCQNTDGYSYSIDSIPSALSYVWCIPGAMTIVSGQGTTSITVNVGVLTGPDTISVYAVNNCDTGFPKRLPIIIYPRPAPVIAGTDTTCTGDTLVLSTAGGMENYLWTVSPDGTIVSGGGPADSTITLVWSTGGMKFVTVSCTLNGCQSIQPTLKDVWVLAGPPVSLTIAPAANPVCTGTPVIYTAIPVNEGTSPVYQWNVNGINAGTNNPTFSYTPVNGDIIQCTLTSNMPCASGNPAVSNSITMIVSPILPVSDSVWASANPVCAGTPVTFTVIPTNGGTNPVFQWKLNGANTGANSPTFTFTPSNGDFVTCTLTSSETCTTGNPATSNLVTMMVDPILPVNISISASDNPFCPGSSVTYTATPTNGGTTPQYQWQVNGINVGTNDPIYSYIPASLDLVSCILTSSEPCPTWNPDTSNTITMIPNLSFPAGVSIVANPNPFCPGSSVTFTASPFNGGTSPTYQWKVNGINTGTNSPIFVYNPANNDSVRCVMTSNLACVTGNPVTSNQIILSGSLASVVTFSACFDTITTTNAKPIKLKGGIPLGGTYSGPGVSGGYFYPNLAGVGTHVITYTYVNAALCSNSTSSRIHEFTIPIFNCGNNLIDIRDGKIYPTVQIGGQCWMAVDLDYGVQIAETIHQRDNCIIEKYSRPSSLVPRPSYYQWDELMRYDPTPGPQGLCPPGWHVPTEAEWATLFANWTNNAFAGAPLKYSGYSGFNAFLSGARHETVQWDYQGFAVFFWSSTAYGPYKAWAHGMNDPDYSVSYYPSLRSNAFSVRCIQD